MAIANGARPIIQSSSPGRTGSSFSTPGMTLVRMVLFRVLTGALRCGAKAVAMTSDLRNLTEYQGNAALHILMHLQERVGRRYLFEELANTAKGGLTEQIRLYNRWMDCIISRLYNK